MHISTNQIQKIFEVHTHRVSSVRMTPDIDLVHRADSLMLSRQALDMQAVKQAVAKLPDIRDDVVRSIRNEIASGSYKIDEVDLAQKMLTSSVLAKQCK